MTAGPAEKTQSAGLWLVYAFFPEPTGFGYVLLKFSFYFSIDITPLDLKKGTKKPKNRSVFVDKAVNQIITATESAMGEKRAVKSYELITRY